MNAITAENLTKQFDSKMAVDNISFNIEEGEFLVIVGPSGCGKTTTLRMLSGLESVTSGRILFGERDVTHVRPKYRNIGMVFQDYAVFPHLTVYENIAYGLRARRTHRIRRIRRARRAMTQKHLWMAGKKFNLPHQLKIVENIAYGLRARRADRAMIQERVAMAAEKFNIAHLLRRKPRQLSGGERQRIALARAMVRDADVYLYDEPLSNLDAQLRHSAREDILALHREKGKPSIYVTHDQSEAMAMGDRIAILRDGRLEQIATGSDLYQKPCNLFVAFFIGTPSINLFDVTLEAEDGDVWARGEAIDLMLSDEIAQEMEKYVGRAVKIGIRPEDLHVPKKAPFPVDESNTLQGVVNVIEPSATGCSTYLMTTDETEQDFVATFKLRIPASYIGREIPLAINTAKLHLFDAETELSLRSYDASD